MLGVGELHLRIGHAEIRVLRGRHRAVVAVHDPVVHLVALLLVHDGAAGLGVAKDACGNDELVQQPGVIGIAQVLEIDLPIGRDSLAAVAQHLDRLAEDAVEVFQAQIVEKRLKRLDVRIEGAEYHTAVGRDVEHVEPMRALVEALGHAAGTVDAALERHADQVPPQVIAPMVVDAGVAVVGAERGAHELGAAMGTAVHERANLAVRPTVDHHRRVAHESGLVIAGIGDLGLQREIAPYRSAEDSLLFLVVEIGVGEDAIGNPAVVPPWAR